VYVDHAQFLWPAIEFYAASGSKDQKPGEKKVWSLLMSALWPPLLGGIKFLCEPVCDWVTVCRGMWLDATPSPRGIFAVPFTDGLAGQEATRCPCRLCPFPGLPAKPFLPAALQFITKRVACLLYYLHRGKRSSLNCTCFLNLKNVLFIIITFIVLFKIQSSFFYNFWFE